MNFEYNLIEYNLIEYVLLLKMWNKALMQTCGKGSFLQYPT